MRARAIAVVLALLPLEARANGAFPDSLGIFVPVDRAEEIILATNFGVLMSRDGGDRFRWVCEGAISPFPYMYALSGELLLAADAGGLYSSSDGGCSWSRANGPPAAPEITDVFPDPSDPLHVLILGRPTLSSTTSWALYESFDGGKTFGDEKYLTPKRYTLESVEIATSDPRIWYMTLTSATTMQRFVLRSENAGESFESFDVVPDIGTRLPRIAAVDPLDANTIYFRLARTAARDPEAFGISTDGGRTIQLRATLDARMTGFLRRADGSLIITTFQSSYTSTTGGATFHPWAGAPHIRGIAERAGLIYAATDDVVDTYAIAVTRDGTSWTPLLELSRIAGMLDCPNVQASCETAWGELITRLMIEPPPVEEDAGALAKPDASAAGASATDAGVPPPADSGCRCAHTRANRENRANSFGFLIACVLLATATRRVQAAADRCASRSNSRR